MTYSKYIKISCAVGVLALIVHHHVEGMMILSNDSEEVIKIEKPFDSSFEKIELKQIKEEMRVLSSDESSEVTKVEVQPKIELANALGDTLKSAYVLPKTGGLNVRSGAGIEFEILGSLKDESKVEVYKEIDGWYQIKFGDYIGYVSKPYMTDQLEPKVETPIVPQEPSEQETKPSQPTNGFYQNIKAIQNPNALGVLVNKNYALSSSYQPSDLRTLNVPSVNGTIYLRSEAASQAEALFAAARNEEGLILQGRSGFRSYQTQADLYKRYVNANGQTKADTFSARPGHSEHQTGLALDITAASVNGGLTTSFGGTAEGQWVKLNAHRFGFIITYPKGRESETGYQYEPWHIRYVGVNAATQISQNNWILDEYVVSAGLISTN